MEARKKINLALMNGFYKSVSRSLIVFEKKIILLLSKNSNDIFLCWWLIWLNANFNNISVISWRLVLLVEQIGVPGENYRPISSY
jgi:hypothetical protein